MVRFNKYQKNQYLNSLDRSYFKELDDLEDTEENRKAFLERCKRTFFKRRNGILGEIKETSPLNEDNTTLAWALSPLSYESISTKSDSTHEEKKEWLRGMLGMGFMEHQVLQNEFNQAISDSNFPWNEFLTANKIIKADDNITDEKAKALAQSWVSGILDELPEILKEVDG